MNLVAGPGGFKAATKMTEAQGQVKSGKIQENTL
jgi:hypothetical protein